MPILCHELSIQSPVFLLIGSRLAFVKLFRISTLRISDIYAPLFLSLICERILWRSYDLILPGNSVILLNGICKNSLR